jgi:hypothetical protein
MSDEVSNDSAKLERDTFDPKALTVEELIEERKKRQESVDSINIQLKDNEKFDLGKSEEWKARAERARKYIWREIQSLSEELSRRAKTQTARQSAHPASSEPASRPGQSRHLSDLGALLDSREEANRQRIRESEQRTRNQAEMFVDAARQKLSLDQFQELWSLAKKLYPDSPDWTVPKGAGS